MKLPTYLVPLLFTFIATESKPEEYITCNTCYNHSDYMERLTKLVNDRSMIWGYRGTIYIANFKSNQIRGWRVNARYKLDYDDEATLYIDQKPIEPSLYLSDMVNNISKNEIVINSIIDVPISSGFESAWDIARGSRNREALDQWYHDYHPVSYWLRTLGPLSGGLFFNPINGLEYIFRFEDGSTITMVAPRFSDARLILEYKPNSARDKDNNVICDSGQSLSGDYYFSSQKSMNDFLFRASLYGVEVRNVSYLGGGGLIKFRITIVDIH
ncbi:hypothetical protein [Ferrimonas balearica]|uniref:hypothetical protein n=1 Tax=Ferrimonas balearica TaxID=44012 RepID=UPI001F1D2B11|nr:hypothetical protein [Ferrimonas balearica]MBY6093428.1 hypothetical protein [Ferrimonas balearica]